MKIIWSNTRQVRLYKIWNRMFLYKHQPIFCPQDEIDFTLPELKEIVREMEKMEWAND